MIHTELYKVFYYVATYRNISKAADKLFISQPAISKSIKKLEELTGCILFIRSSKGVKLTTEGEILFEYVKKAFDYLHSGEKIIEKLNKKEDGLVKVGISNTLCKYYFLPHLQAFHQSYPDIKVQIMNRPSPSTFDFLNAGKIDFAIISIPNNNLDYEYIHLMTVHDIIVGTKKYMPCEEYIALDELTQYPLMMLEKDNQTRIYLDDFFKSYNISLDPEIEIGSMEFLIEFAKIGIGIAYVIKEFVESELINQSLFEVPIDPHPLPRKIGIALKKNMPLSIAAKTFIEYLTL